MSVKIIAEAGVNHNGSLACAKELIEAAANAGADIVKFQSFRAKDLALPSAPKAKYQQKFTDKNESQMEMLKKLELDEVSHLELIEHCKKYEIEFLSSPFDIESINLLLDMGLKTIKVPSGELTNAPYLMKIGASGCKVLLSTGMSTLEEIELALGVLAFNYLKYTVPLSLEAFSSAFRDPMAANALGKYVTLLHCTSEYPASYEDLNLLAIDLMREHFELPV
ncbi:MAG: N-acetylneuraminate synthase, partial [SAR324 cluster bacterium]|nr:N-acetylneuraminate synthase [SAR324 cluster bacterium]